MPETDKTRDQLLAEIESLRARVAALQARAPQEPPVACSFQQILESAPVGFALFDAGPRFLFINRTLAAINGIPAADHLGRTLGEVLPGLQPGIEPFMKLVRDSGEPVRDVEIIGETSAAPGETRHWLASYYPVSLNGGEPGVGTFVQDITERKRAEEALRRAEKTYRELVEYAPLGIFRTTTQGRYLMANSRLAEMYGYDSVDDLKHSVKDIGVQFYMDPAERAEVLRAVARGEVKRMEVRRRRKDGSPMWVALSVRAVRDHDGNILHYEGFSNDITERRQAEEALRESEQWRRLALDAAKAWPWVWDLRTNASVWPDELFDLFMIEPGSCEPSHEAWLDSILPEDRPRVEAAVRAAADRGGELQLEWRVNSPSAPERWLLSRGSPRRDAEGRIASYLGIVIDITERKRAEELRDQIERTIRHDLRIPASNAIHLAKMIRNELPLTEELSDLLGYFEHAGQNMLDTLNSSLDLYKIETGQYRLTPVACDCLALVREMVDTLTKKVPFANLRLDVSMDGRHDPDSPRPCRCEPKLLRMALQNLLVNALEASPPGGEVVVELSSDRDCRVTIKNRGAIPADIRDRFFDKYATRGKSKGTGIGTYSAIMMINAQGGDIAVRTSDEDDETVVTVRMPC